MQKCFNASGRVRLFVVDARGRCHSDSGWIKNLILNQGLDGIASRYWADSFTHCAVGNSSTPTKVNGGATQASQSNVTVTLSGGSFTFTNTATDAGKVLKFANGHEVTISSIVNPTHATVTTSATEAAQSFDVYQTTQTGLVSELHRTNSYYTNGGGCGTILAAPNTVRLRRTFEFPMEVTTTVYREVGFSWSGSAGNNLFSRIVVSDTAVGAGLKLRVLYELQITMASATPTVRNANISGWPVAPATNTTGYESLEDWGMATVTSSGATAVYRIHSGIPIVANEPSASADGLVGPFTEWLVSPGDPVLNRWATGSYAAVLLSVSYVTGSHFIERTLTVPTDQARLSTLRVFSMGHIISPTEFLPTFTLILSEEQTKTGSYLLDFSFGISWGRTLS